MLSRGSAQLRSPEYHVQPIYSASSAWANRPVELYDAAALFKGGLAPRLYSRARSYHSCIA